MARKAGHSGLHCRPLLQTTTSGRHGNSARMRPPRRLDHDFNVLIQRHQGPHQPLQRDVLQLVPGWRVASDQAELGWVSIGAWPWLPGYELGCRQDRLSRTGAVVERDRFSTRPRAQGRFGHSLIVPQARCGSQYCLRAAQAQSGRSKKPSVAQRANSLFSSPTQASGSCAGISVTRKVDRGPEAGASAVCSAGRGAVACSWWVGAADCGWLGACSGATSGVGTDSGGTMAGMDSGEAGACSCVTGAGSEGADSGAASMAGKGASGMRTGPAAVEPVRGVLGELQETTSSTNAP